MGRRLLSHLLITAAIFSLSMTFFIWVIDMAVLTPTNLTKALREGGVPSAIASIIPDQAAKGDEGDNKNCQNNQPGNTQLMPENTGCQPKVKSEQDKKEEAEMKAKIASIITPDYVDQKLANITTSFIGFIKDPTKSPTLDISDFPTKLRASGVEVGDDIDKNFAKPIDLNANGRLNVLPKAYPLFKVMKYAGAIFCILLLVAEYFVAAKGDKLHRIGRIFLHVGFWYTVWWVALVLVPTQVLPRLKDKVQAGESIDNLIDAIAKSIQHLLSRYFLSFAIVCWLIAIVLYAVRHMRKHVDKIQAVPAAKNKLKPLPNKR